MKSRENNDYYMNEDFINEQMNAIIHFANRFNRCKYVVISDELNDYWKYYWRQYVEFKTNYEYNLLIVDENELQDKEYADCIKNSKLIIEEGGACYSYKNDTIYIAVPYESNEYTLLRTLTHEYGHCIQNANGYNRENCDKYLLEYHNIWFYENPYSQDTKQCFDHINEDGFRMSYNTKYHEIEESVKYKKLIYNNFFNEFLSYDIETFQNNIFNTRGIEPSNKSQTLCNEIYNSINYMKVNDSIWLLSYMKLLAHFLCE